MKTTYRVTYSRKDVRYSNLADGHSRITALSWLALSQFGLTGWPRITSIRVQPYVPRQGP